VKSETTGPNLRRSSWPGRFPRGNRLEDKHEGEGGSYSLDGRGPLLADLGVLLLDNEHPLLPRDFEDEVVWV